MAISGSRNFTLSRDEIIESALKIVGVYDAGEAVPAAEASDAASRLNLIIKELHAEGLQMPVRARNLLILNENVQRYRLGNIGTTNTVDDFHFFDVSELLENVLITTALVATDVQYKIDDDTWIDYAGNTLAKNTTTDDTLSVGIRLDDGGIHWSTQTAVAAGTIDVTAGIPTGKTVAVGNKVYAYLHANRQTRPVRILYANREDTSGNSSQVELIGRTSYELLSRKRSAGPPTQAHYSPTVNAFASGESAGELFVWPTGNPGNLDKLFLTCEHYLDDFDIAGDNIPLPIEWGNTVIWTLASELAYEYGVERDIRRELKAIAEGKRNTLLDLHDVESASFRIAREPDYNA